MKYTGTSLLACGNWHSCLTPAKNEGIDIGNVGPNAEGTIDLHLFIHSMASVNRNIIGYNK